MNINFTQTREMYCTLNVLWCAYCNKTSLRFSGEIQILYTAILQGHIITLDTDIHNYKVQYTWRDILNISNNRTGHRVPTQTQDITNYLYTLQEAVNGVRVNNMDTFEPHYNSHHTLTSHCFITIIHDTIYWRSWNKVV